MSEFLTGPSPAQPSGFDWAEPGPDFETVPPAAAQPQAPVYEPTAPEPVKNSGHTKRVIGMLAGAGVLVLGTIVGAAAMSGPNKILVHGTMQLPMSTVSAAAPPAAGATVATTTSPAAPRSP